MVSKGGIYCPFHDDFRFGYCDYERFARCGRGQGMYRQSLVDFPILYGTRKIFLTLFVVATLGLSNRHPCNQTWSQEDCARGIILSFVELCPGYYYRFTGKGWHFQYGAYDRWPFSSSVSVDYAIQTTGPGLDAIN